MAIAHAVVTDAVVCDKTRLEGHPAALWNSVSILGNRTHWLGSLARATIYDESGTVSSTEPAAANVNRISTQTSDSPKRERPWTMRPHLTQIELKALGGLKAFRKGLKELKSALNADFENLSDIDYDLCMPIGEEVDLSSIADVGCSKETVVSCDCNAEELRAAAIQDFRGNARPSNLQKVFKESFMKLATVQDEEEPVPPQRYDFNDVPPSTVHPTLKGHLAPAEPQNADIAIFTIGSDDDDDDDVFWSKRNFSPSSGLNLSAERT